MSNDMDYQLKMLKAALAQEEEILSVLSDVRNHVGPKKSIEQLKANIRKLEEWGHSQEIIRTQTEMAFSSGAPCGGV